MTGEMTAPAVSNGWGTRAWQLGQTLVPDGCKPKDGPDTDALTGAG